MFLFNPDNDLAIANFSPNYTPPASVLKLGLDLDILPIWYAPDSSIILIQSKLDVDFFENIKQLFNIKSTILNINDISNYKNNRLYPWGWNPMLKKKLIEFGLLDQNLPSDIELNLLREYSNRKNAVKILSELKSEKSYFNGDSFYITNINDLLLHLSKSDGDYALKMPLSGSGRGLIWILDGITDKQTDWAKRVIKTQGGIVAEPKLNRVQDFAMEFSIYNGSVKFEGYSLFESADSGAYMGNLLMHDYDIEKELSTYISINILYDLRKSFIEKIGNYFPQYSGFLGVDMMICNTDEGYKLQPCIEINMRMNMGLVSHSFFNRYVHNNSKGIYKVEYFKKSGDAFQFHQQMLIANSAVIEDGRIRMGYMSLTPVKEDTKYIAWVLID